MKSTPTKESAANTLRLPPHRRAVPTRTRLRTAGLPLPVYVAILLLLPVAVLVAADASGWLINSGRFVPATALGAEALGVAGHDAGRNSGRGEAGATPGSGGAADGSRAGGAAGTSASPGSLDPDDVRGSMTLRQVLDAFPKVTAAEIRGKFGVPADTPTSTQLKTLAKDGNGYEVSELREWLKTRTDGS